jgi:hypothetical protein
MPRVYRLFDRHLVSSIDLRLLSEETRPSGLVEPAVRLLVSEDSVAVSGAPIFGGSEFAVTYYDRGGRGYARLERTGHLAVVEPDGLTVTIHPEEGRESSEGPDVFGRIADRLVTGVLSRLPILWGFPSMHGAVLETSVGAVIIFGSSGNGKSTVSQILKRDYGWVLHDDDTVMVSEHLGGARLVPMGAAARIRQDAADYLQLSGMNLPGYHGGKLYLSLSDRNSETGPTRLGLPVALFELSPGTHFHRRHITRLDSIDAVAALWGHMFRTNDSLEQRRACFRVVKALSESPYFRVHYRHGVDSAHDVAGLLADLPSEL